MFTISVSHTPRDEFAEALGCQYSQLIYISIQLLRDNMKVFDMLTTHELILWREEGFSLSQREFIFFTAMWLTE